jgi:hypothetical protein
VKRFFCIILCVVLLTSVAACADNVWDLIDDAIDQLLLDLTTSPDVADPPLSESPAPDQNPVYDPGPTHGTHSGALDMSSAEAFIDDVSSIYDITLIDGYDLLSGSEGSRIMEEIEFCLMLFSPGFLQRLVYLYAGHGSGFFIRLEGPSDYEFGSIEWDDDLVIFLRYDDNPDENGVNAATLAHELGHAVHFIVEEIVGEEQIENDLRSVNGDFTYAGDRYHSVWDEAAHITVFAYNYGMFDHYEDIATIFEMLAGDPGGMSTRLNDPESGILRQKTEYIRELALVVSEDTGGLFDPLEREELPLAA